MIVADLPHDEDAEIFSAVTLTIKLREVIIIAPSSIANGGLLANYAPLNVASNSPTVSSGIISATAAAGSALGYLHLATVVGIRI